MSRHWAVILAGGDGTRLQSMTRAITGDNRPKQFVPVIGGSTLLDQTRRRVALSIEPSRTLIVVTKKHRRFYKPLAEEISPALLVEQPLNRGNSAGDSLCPAEYRDKIARSHGRAVPFRPLLRWTTKSLCRTSMSLSMQCRSNPRQWCSWESHQALRKLNTDGLNRSLRYSRSAENSITRVSKFWEKPGLNLATSLMERGCLWNSFVIVGRVDALLKMTQAAMPELYAGFAAITPRSKRRLKRQFSPNSIRKSKILIFLIRCLPLDRKI